MMLNTISGQKLRQMLVAGANKLEAAKQAVNDMNVFPVPDGDTGTNMSLTMTSAVREALSLNGNAEECAKVLSSGALKGARGNSGVILSQIFRGFYKGIKGKEALDILVLAEALQKGTETAYKAIMKPKEGTILTVARAASEAAVEHVTEVDTVTELMQFAVDGAAKALAQTPEMLPVLKEAGVVDAGGQGLLLILEGFLEALQREDEETDSLLADGPVATTRKEEFCVELVIRVAGRDPKTMVGALKEEMSSLGDKLLLSTEDKQILLHLHTEDVNEVLVRAMKVGQLVFVKAMPAAEAHEHCLSLKKEEPEQPRKEIGFISVSSGEGMQKIFTDLGVDFVIKGGQTMNPSTDDVLSAAARVNAETVFVLPNNKNIILAAKQAADVCKDCRLVVIPTTSIPQGVSAMLGYVPGESIEDNQKSMTESAEAIVSGAVTYAVRDTHMGEFDIREGNILGLKDGAMCRVGTDLMDTTMELLQEMVTEETGVLTIYCGEETNEEMCGELRQRAEEAFPEVEIDMQQGQQPIYYFLLSAE